MAERPSGQGPSGWLYPAGQAGRPVLQPRAAAGQAAGSCGPGRSHGQPGSAGHRAAAHLPGAGNPAVAVSPGRPQGISGHRPAGAANQHR